MKCVSMLNTIDDIGFIRQVETAILEHCKEVHELTYVEHGANNIVALVNKAYTFRFPRDEISARRLVFETALLQKLKGKIDTIHIPDLKQVHTGHLYTVAAYIPGEQLTGEEIKKLSEREQQAVGIKLASFIDQLTRGISGLEIQRLRTEANVEGLKEPPPGRFRRLFGMTLPNDKLRPIVQEYYSLWQQYAGQEQATYAVHDNLYAKNMLFKAAELTGILDFADANVGSVESEMRGMYEMGDLVLKSAIDQYQSLSGTQVAYDHVRVWAVVYELAIFVDFLARQQTEEPIFMRSQERLRQWVPGFPF